MDEYPLQCCACHASAAHSRDLDTAMTSLVRTNAYFERALATTCANTLISERHRQSQGAVMKCRINGNISLVKFIEGWNHVDAWEEVEGKKEKCKGKYCKRSEMHD